jgi:hypothetical protein
VDCVGSCRLSATSMLRRISTTLFLPHREGKRQVYAPHRRRVLSAGHRSPLVHIPSLLGVERKKARDMEGAEISGPRKRGV